LADLQRIDDLRHRVQKDPASIAFAQLAEELRRSGQLQDSVDTARAGLTRHPTYLSARITLARALVELGHLDDASVEFELVLRNAADNLAAVRGLGEIYQRRGALESALTQYQAALDIAPNDPDLEEAVASLSRQLEARMSGVGRMPIAGPASLAVQFVPEPQDPERECAARTVAALQGWLDAINVARADRRA
jgi:tetratricopeptide (TPR) repeat protein